MNLVEVLSSQEIYQKQIAKLQRKLELRNNLYSGEEDEIPLYNFIADQDYIAKTLAKMVRKEQYEPSLVIPKIIFVRRKKRITYKLAFLDYIFQSALCECINSKIQALSSKQLFSYLKGRGNNNAVQSFAAYLRTNLNQPLKRSNMYIFTTDIQSYMDSIPLDSHSELWLQLQEIFTVEVNLRSITPYLLSLLERMIRPFIKDKEGNIFQLRIGVTTGTPISNVVGNLYLMQMDKVLTDFAGGFYIRYCDDLLLAHPNQESLLSQSEKLIMMVQHKHLKCNPKKTFYYYLTHAGKKGKNEKFIGTSALHFLGYLIHSTGTIALPHKTTKKISQTIRRQIHNIVQIDPITHRDKEGKVICTFINETLNFDNPLSLAILRTRFSYLTNRPLLRQLDYIIALTVAEILSGTKGPKAFRQVSYKKIRNIYGLKSLCQIKNGCAIEH